LTEAFPIAAERLRLACTVEGMAKNILQQFIDAHYQLRIGALPMATIFPGSWR
jgi:hypothetical protein